MTQPIDTLPLHLGLMMMNWLSSQSVWQIAKSGLLPSNPEWTSIKNPPDTPPNNLKNQKKAPSGAPNQAAKPQHRGKMPAVQNADLALQSLQKLERLLDPRFEAAIMRSQTELQMTPSLHSKKPSLAPKTKENLKNNRGDDALFTRYLEIMDHPQMLEAIRQESYRRAVEMLQGLEQFQSVAWTHRPTPSQGIWRGGGATLRDYGGDRQATAVFCIPSLINKSYILDLYPRRSLMQFLQKEGYRPLLLDWGEPGTLEKRYDCAEYVQEVLIPAFRYLRRHHEGPIIVLGYCMGGIFALALAQLEAFYTDGLILLATPWSFKSEDVAMSLDAETIATYERMIMEQEVLPPVWIQTLFHMINPWHFQEKFQRFPQMSRDEKRHFIAVESWVNDGVPLAKRVARECLVDWPHKNTLAEGKWRIGGWRIDPSRVTCPTLMLAPTEDRIVPLESSLPLATLITQATCLQPQSGHVSMVVGKKAPSLCWKPVSEWISALHNS